MSTFNATKVCCLNGLQRMEPLWSPVVATGGKRSQIAQAQNGRNQAKTVALGCRNERMVRRGSTVRVRQRALQKRRTSPDSRGAQSDPFAERAGCGAGSLPYRELPRRLATHHPAPLADAPLRRQNQRGAGKSDCTFEA